MSISLDDVQKSLDDQLSNSSWFSYEHGHGLNRDRDIAHTITGLNEEAGEVAGLLKKQVFRGNEKPRERWVSEFGDVMWYLFATMTLMGISAEEVWKHNCDKLNERRKVGFKGGAKWEG